MVHDAAEPWDITPGGGTGLGRTFARRILELDPSVTEVWMLACGVGGTQVSVWQAHPRGPRFEACVLMARLAETNGAPVRAILWHQGEADAMSEARAKAYSNRLRDAIDGLRSELGALPFVAGELGRFVKYPYRKTVVAATRKLMEQLAPTTGFVASDGLSQIGDGLHFDTASLRVLGVRYAEELHRIAPVLAP
jgi:hypothetical protein